MQPGTGLRIRTQRLLSTVIAAALILAAPGGPQFVRAQAQNLELTEARRALDDFYSPLESMRGSLDRSLFDLSEAGMQLAFEDAEEITLYVNENVRFEPYRGALRGAKGALASGAGNSLDQALLTGALLADAGYEVELRGATLTGEQIELLLHQVRPGAAPTGGVSAEVPAFATEAELDELHAELAAELGALERDVVRVNDLLSAGAPLEGASHALLVDASRDYYWPAFRLHDGEPWSDAHPVFGATPPQFEGLEPERTYVGDLPQELLHRFGFQVFIESRIGDELVVRPVTALWERPTANLYGVSLSYANVPDGLESVDDASDIGALMNATSFFFPMLEGEVAAGGQAFDMMGFTVPPEEAQSPFAPLFQTVAGAFGSAAGALGNIGFGAQSKEPEPVSDVVSLTAQWFEFTFTAPGEEPVVHRRMVVDRLGAEAREAGSVRLNPDVSEKSTFAALASVHTFMLDTGSYSPAYVEDRVLESVLAMRSYADEALVCALEGTPPPTVPTELTELEAPLGPLTLFSAFNDAVTDSEVVSYRPAPAMVVMSQGLDGTGSAVDVVANPRWSLRVGNGGVAFDPSITRRAGVWETRTEALPLGGRGVVIPSFEALAETKDAAGLLTLDPTSQDAAAELPVPLEARLAIIDDLKKGYTVLFPAGAAPTELAKVGWWRVDPVTGETLGRGGDGRGSAFLEYLTSFEVSVAITAGFTVYGVHDCTKKEDPRIAGCCILQNIALAGVGMGVGAAIGIGYNIAAGSARALLLFLGLDVIGNLAGTQIEPVCR